MLVVQTCQKHVSREKNSYGNHAKNEQMCIRAEFTHDKVTLKNTAS
jgi:hypothetical protein